MSGINAQIYSSLRVLIQLNFVSPLLLALVKVFGKSTHFLPITHLMSK